MTHTQTVRTSLFPVNYFFHFFCLSLAPSHSPSAVVAGVWKKLGRTGGNQSTMSCYFIQVNYLSLLSYIQWKLSNKTMTYKTSLKNILLNGKRLLLLAVGVWTTQSVNMGRCVPGRLIMYSGLIYKTKKYQCVPLLGFDPQSTVHCVAGNCSNHCATTAVNVHMSWQHRTSHSSLITIAQNNCVAALYCVPVVPRTLCPPAGRTKRKLSFWLLLSDISEPFFSFQKFAYISFKTDTNIT